MPLWSVLPFVCLLLAIAVLPLLLPGWWHSNWNKALVSLGFGIPVGIFVALRHPSALGHTGLEYAAFISLLGSLFVISGGLRLGGSLPSTPASNVALLAVGAVLANLVGTTGAAMLLVRPFLQANRARSRKAHLLVFFILIVANCGGCLTPLGDPPLFLGFLKGVPFLWTLTLWKEWAFVCGLLLVTFYGLDRMLSRGEGSPPSGEGGVRLEGAINLLGLAGVIGTILVSGLWVKDRYGETTAQIFQSAGLLGLGGLSLVLTPRRVREANEFSWHPFGEVVVLFLGIFAAMIPALEVLRSKGPSLGVSSPAGYFWATGSLSSILDNAPTYLAFYSAAQYLPDEVAGTSVRVLSAISLGSVFFGALTYLGNGPNLLVRAIAEQAGVKTPSFFGYIAWAAIVLVPILALVTILFFR